MNLDPKILPRIVGITGYITVNSNITYASNKTTTNDLYKLDSYKSKDINEIKALLENNNLNVIVIGNGDKIINQYPNKDTKVVDNDKVFLITNGNTYKMHNLTNWSRYDIFKYCDLTGLSCNIEGSGYAVDQSISIGAIIDSETKLKIKLEKEQIN